MRPAISHQGCRVVGIDSHAAEDARQHRGAGGVHIHKTVTIRIPDLILDFGEVFRADAALIVKIQHAVVSCARTTIRIHPRAPKQVPQLRRVGHGHAGGAVGGRARFVAVNSDVFENSRIQPSILVVTRRRHSPVVLIGVENTVQIHVLAVENVQISAVHKTQFIHRFEGRVLAQVWRVEPQVGVRLRSAGRVGVGAAPPGNNVGGQLRCHTGKRQQHVRRGRVEIQLRCFIHQAEMRGGGWILTVTASDQPERRLAHRHRGKSIRIRVRQCSRRLRIRQNVAYITRRARDGLVRFHARNTIIPRAHFERHRVREIQRQTHQPEHDPNHNDQNGTALAC